VLLYFTALYSGLRVVTSIDLPQRDVVSISQLAGQQLLGTSSIHVSSRCRKLSAHVLMARNHEGPIGLNMQPVDNSDHL
jgi:hypothetical protein